MTLANSSDARRKSSTVRVHSCCDFFRSRAGPVSVRASLPSWTRDAASAASSLRPAASGAKGIRSPLPMALFLVWTCSMIFWIGESSPPLAPCASPAASNMAWSAARACIRLKFVFITASLLMTSSWELQGGSLERRIDNGERPPPRGVVHARQAEHRAQLLGGDVLERARGGRLTGRRLGEAGRAGGVEGHAPFDLLRDLVDVAVQHSDRAEPLEAAERLLAVLRAPAPLRVYRPERNVAEHHDGRAGGQPRHVGLEPVELLVAEDSEALVGALARDVDQPDEVYPVVVEAVPALALGPLAEPFQVFRPVADDVVLAWHVEDLVDLDPLEDLGDGVELLGCRKVGEVAGVDQKIGSLRQCVDPGDGLLQRGGHALLVRVFAEADVAVADLDEREAARPRLPGSLAEGAGREDSAADRPDEACARPGHAFQEPATIHPVALAIALALIRHC